MIAKLRVTLVAVVITFVALLALHPAAESAMAKPEDVGLSGERLARITDMMKRHIAAGEISGGVTLVARHGRIVHLEATGVRNTTSLSNLVHLEELDLAHNPLQNLGPLGGLTQMRILDVSSSSATNREQLPVSAPWRRYSSAPA